MAYPSLRFVSSPDEAATVRLDINGLDATVDIQSLHEGFNLGMPALDGEPGARGRRWGNRKLPLPLQIKGTRAAALSSLNKIAREATRDGWIRWQLDATTNPVWFRVYASSPEALDFSLFTNPGVDYWKASLSLDASPFGQGVLTTLGPFTVTNNPESGTNPMQVTLGTVAGEMPAPALVRVAKAATGGMLGPAAGVSALAPTSVTAASWQSVVDAAVTSTAYIAGAYRQTNATLTTSAWANVCTFTPSTSLTAGRRRALLRLSGSTSAGAFLLRWVASSPAATSQVTTDPTLVSVAQMQRWVDTGVLPFPLADGSALGISGTTVYTLQAKRAATGGEIRFDQRLLLLGVDDSYLQVAAPGDVGTAAADVLFDSDKRTTIMSAGGNLVKPPASRGGWVSLKPSDTNVLFVAQNLDPAPVTSRDDSITSTTSVTVQYRPRYLWGVG